MVIKILEELSENLNKEITSIKMDMETIKMKQSEMKNAISK